jgi:uncharacterized pyridoxamine 5'-phosphate oxidase family protein
MSWQRLESQAPEIAEFGKTRFQSNVAYLATIRKDGSPRVHPFTPIVGEGHFFVFMEPTSPKGHDLRRDPRFAVHCSVTDMSGESGEFILTGRAKFIEDPDLRALAVKHAPYKPAERYILFEFEPESAVITEYEEGKAVRQHWKIDE